MTEVEILKAELAQARADAEATVALVVEEATKQLAAARETFCYASPGSDEEFTSLLLGFDTAAGIIRDLAPEDAIAEVAKLRAERDTWREGSRVLAAQVTELRDRLAAELAAANAREAGLRNFVEDFAAAKIDALRFPRPLSPEDELDPVVEAEEVWAWQADARAALAQPSTEGGK